MCIAYERRPTAVRPYAARGVLWVSASAAACPHTNAQALARRIKFAVRRRLQLQGCSL